jgi:hypothetical protein
MVDLQRPIAGNQALFAAGFKVIDKKAISVLRQTSFEDKNSSRLIRTRILFVRN